MGYVHDTAMSLIIPCNAMNFVTGTWADAAGAVSKSTCVSKAQTDEVGVCTIPITPPQNSVAKKGSYLKSIDVWWNVTTAAADAVTPLIHSFVLPADEAAFPTVVSHAFSYDTGHDSAAKRLTLDEHKMTLTLTTPIWLDNDMQVLVEISFDAAATSDIDVHCARANYTLRV